MWYWLFIKEKTNQYIVLSDDQIQDEGRWILENDHYELIWDSAKSSRKLNDMLMKYMEQHN
ncbi:hypothetical protein [Heyndrickxia sporothermodurans]|uniref:hypothetical protein n=1 Tax=Heyndrickxia sporothermodurans TaxID=46224 RepID=UPI0035D6D1C0